MGESPKDERPELNFTIYHVDSKTGEIRKVPPYTSPGEFFDTIEKEKAATAGQGEVAVANGDRRSNIDDAVPAVTFIDSDVIDDGSDEKTNPKFQQCLM